MATTRELQLQIVREDVETGLAGRYGRVKDSYYHRKIGGTIYRDGDGRRPPKQYGMVGYEERPEVM